ncbi:uncharacterized protein EKO05_0003988 [Ascochyta rabiei]|uniref:uncharacterized protein n=1 Tax=Didymella rabiei TaxID=5454 RepID=UPI002208FD67|nr:uncharacterized protein EKO05_0003988 [Ascochyta rabiei]UPX13482.1 hypothetical protein EKO05_0003988 [Ascochyta rabiei]
MAKVKVRVYIAALTMMVANGFYISNSTGQCPVAAHTRTLAKEKLFLSKKVCTSSLRAVRSLCSSTGHFLGKGSMGDVYTTVVHDYALAWKRVPLIRKMGQRYTKELAILKKLSHTHMIRLIGTYTYQQFLGLLLHLIAVCYLHTFFNDVEAYWSASADDTQKDRLERLHFCSQQPS